MNSVMAVIMTMMMMVCNNANVLAVIVSKAQYTPPTPTRRDSTVSSRRRRRCVLGLTMKVHCLYMYCRLFSAYTIIQALHDPAVDIENNSEY